MIYTCSAVELVMPVKSITRVRLSARRVTDVGHSLAVCTCAQNIARVLMLLDVSLSESQSRCYISMAVITVACT